MKRESVNDEKVNARRASYEYLILGAGPAGLQMGYFLQKNERDYIILEAGESPGTFFDTFPRHRTLISINKVHTGCECPETNLRWDWNSLLSDNYEMSMPRYTQRYFPRPAEFKKYLSDFSGQFDIKVRYSTRVTGISKNGEFRVEDCEGNIYTSKRLIVATGLTKPYVPDIPGIEYGENYFDFSVDPTEFTNKRVLIIGKGNSAFETADNLIETAASIHLCSPSPVRMAWKTHFVGNLRAVNNNFLDTYQLKSQNAILDADIESIERREGKYIVNIIYTHARGERRQIVFDRILVCAGFRFDDSIFDKSCRPALCYNDKFPEQTSEWESTNVKDMYFAGTLMQMRDYKKTMSGFIHGFRYNIRALSHILELKYAHKKWPGQKIGETPEDITGFIVSRINKSSAMFLQPAFSCDVLVMSKSGIPARYLEDVPVDYVHESKMGENEWYYTISLEYGDFHTPPDPFNIERDPDPDVAHLTAYLHPIIRRYSGNTLLREHHIPEDLENVYLAEKYTAPMVEFFRREVADGPRASGSDQKMRVEMAETSQVNAGSGEKAAAVPEQL